MNKLVRFFPETSLINGHDGLSKIAQKSGIDLRILGQGDFLAFMNKRKTAVKLLNGDMIAYLRLKKGHIDPRAIRHLPKYFDGVELKYGPAITDVMREQFPKWFKDEEMRIKFKGKQRSVIVEDRRVK